MVLREERPKSREHYLGSLATMEKTFGRKHCTKDLSKIQGQLYDRVSRPDSVFTQFLDAMIEGHLNSNDVIP